MVCVARSEGPLKEVVTEIEGAGGSAEFITCDIGDGEALAALVDGIHDAHGRLDILVNNAGVTRDGLILRMDDDDFDQVIQVNLRSAFVSCRAAARPMMRGRFGRIINIGSVSGLMGNPGQVNYAASKAAMVGLTKSIAKELGAKGVTANVVAPGFIETDMTAVLDEKVREAILERVPMSKFGSPDDIAHTAVFLAMEPTGYMTGQVLTVDGGMVM